MAFIGQISGRHYNSYEEMVVGEKIAVAHRDASIIADQDEVINSIPLDTLRTIADRAAIAADAAQSGKRSRADVAAWGALHPEWKDTPSNIRLMDHELKRQGVLINPTVGELERAYNSLTESGLLDLNEKKLREREQKLAQQRANTIQESGGPLPAFNEDEAYSIDMDQLRVRANQNLGF